MKRKIVFPVIVLSSIFLSGCLFGTNSSKLVSTESITTTEETTEATTTTETTETETVATTTTETSEETSETTAATKATTKPTSKKTTKPTSKKTTKPTSKKVNTTKKVVKKSPTKAPAKKPSKGYAIVKLKIRITLNEHDSNGNNIKITEYCECEASTTEYHSKKASHYHTTSTGNATKKAFLKKFNYRNYSSQVVKVVKFLN